MTESREVLSQPFTKQQRRRQRQEERTRKEQELKQAERKRKITRRVLTAAGLALAGSIPLYIATHPSRRSAERNEIGQGEIAGTDIAVAEQDFKQKAERASPLISKAEAAMEFLYQRVQSDIAAAQNPTLKRFLEQPFEVVRINKANPTRNIYDLYLTELGRQKAQGKRKLAGVNLPLVDRRYFFYGLFDDPILEQVGAAAAFAPLVRLMALRENLDPNNLLDALGVYHEVGHAIQDTGARQGVFGISYQAFESILRQAQPSTILNFEVEMYGAQLWLLNYLTDGRFSKDCQEKTFRADNYIPLLNLRTDQQEQLEVFGDYGTVFFQSGSSPLVISERFFEFVAHDTARRGLEVYRIVDVSEDRKLLLKWRKEL